MKRLPFMTALALALPLSAAATVSTEAQQTNRSGEVIQSTQAAAGAHRPLFIVKYVLLPAPTGAPRIHMDDQGAQIVPPPEGSPSVLLGALQQDPNVDVCYGWGCERKP